MYVLIFVGIIGVLALSLVRVKHEIKKSQEVYKELDEAIELNKRAFAEFNRIILSQTQNGSASRLEARLVEVYLSRLRADYAPSQVPLQSREIGFAAFRESLEPRYESVPQEFRSSGRLDYCESFAG